MWLLLALCSAMMLGLYDVAKKQAVTGNAVLPVLLLNTLFSSLIFLPTILDAQLSLGWFEGTIFESTRGDLHDHLRIMAKSVIVLSSWILGYFAIKHLPLTIVGPINATRPVMVLIGALIIFGERLNLYQWIGVSLSFLSLYLLSRSSRKEGIIFSESRWVIMLAAAAILGACSGLYDKHIMREMNPIFVQSWYNIYQMAMMGSVVLLLWLPQRKSSTPFHWSWAIPLISIFISLADFAYFSALTDKQAMISIVSTIRRGSVIVSFLFAALLLHEKNLKGKVIDLILILIGMIFLYVGSSR